MDMLQELNNQLMIIKMGLCEECGVKPLWMTNKKYCRDCFEIKWREANERWNERRQG